MAQRQVPRLHRGPQARATRRRADRVGAGQVRRRVDTRHRRRDEPVDVPVRRRYRDDDQAGQLRDADHRREPGVRDGICGRTAAGFRRSSRRRCGWKARSSRTSGWPARSTTVGDVEVPAGTTVMLLPGACNRDERKFEDPDTFSPTGRNVREQIAFIRGVHSCPGAPLARAEGRISLNRILDRMTDITVSEEHHGPAGERRYAYEPTFIMRGLSELHIKFKPDPVAGQVSLPCSHEQVGGQLCGPARRCLSAVGRRGRRHRDTAWRRGAHRARRTTSPSGTSSSRRFRSPSERSSSRSAALLNIMPTLRWFVPGLEPDDRQRRAADEAAHSPVGDSGGHVGGQRRSIHPARTSTAGSASSCRPR